MEKRGWLFGGAVEREWECWLLRVTIRKVISDKGSIHRGLIGTELTKFRQTLERNLQGCLLYISTMAIEYRDHMPTPHEPIRNSHFRILAGHTASDSWGGIIKKLLSETASANILG